MRLAVQRSIRIRATAVRGVPFDQIVNLDWVERG